MDRLDVLDQRVNALEKIFETDSKVTPRKKKSISEFFIESAPADDIQRTLVIAYYIEVMLGFDSFSSKDLTKGFKDAREISPKNINLTIYQNVKKGNFMEVEKKEGVKAYVLTNSGINLVENGLKKDD